MNALCFFQNLKTVLKIIEYVRKTVYSFSFGTNNYGNLGINCHIFSNALMVDYHGTTFLVSSISLCIYMSRRKN